MQGHAEFSEPAYGPRTGTEHLADTLQVGDGGEATVSHAGVQRRFLAGWKAQAADLSGVAFPVERLDDPVGRVGAKG